MTTAYLHHGRSTNGPFMTEQVREKTTKIPTAAFLNGTKMQPTSRMVLFAGRWRRVYAEWDSSLFIAHDGGKIAVQIVAEG